MPQSSGSYDDRWYVLNVNPEPWAVGPLDLLRRNGKLAPTMGRNLQLYMYQQAVKEEMQRCYPDVVELPPHYELDFWFWRNTERGNIADATNLQKATEDALQGVLLKNDRLVVRVGSTIVAQGADVTGALAFRVRWGIEPIENELTEPVPVFILAEKDQAEYQQATPINDNSWPPR